MPTARVKKSVSAAERRSDFHAGPGDKEPIGPQGQHLQAAWDLAGRVKGADADQIRRKIVAFAREHGMEDRLPQSAHDWIRAHMGDLARKARGDDLREVIHYAYQQIPEYMPEERRRFIQIVQDKGNAEMLPDEAHGFMHEQNMPHTHSDDDHPQHVHVVHKAFNPVSKEFFAVKSYPDEHGMVRVIEGWLSTPDQDLEKDVVQPESFKVAMKSYFRRNAPLSFEHKTDRLPAGHLNRAAIVRDGKIVTEAVHRTDPKEFEHFQESMDETGTKTGVYVRGYITDDGVAKSVGQGDMGSFSYIANLTKYRTLPGGGREFLEQDPWLESTVAAYPVNKNAVITVAKAYGLEEHTDMGWEDQLEELLAGAAAPEHQPTNPAPVTKSVTADELKGLFTQMKTELTAEIQAQYEARVESEVESKVQKALETMRGQSAGRQAPPSDEPTMDDKPLDYIIRKARSVKSDKDLSNDEQALILGITKKVLIQGMKDSEE